MRAGQVECVGRVNTSNTAQGLGDTKGCSGGAALPFLHLGSPGSLVWCFFFFSKWCNCCSGLHQPSNSSIFSASIPLIFLVFNFAFIERRTAFLSHFHFIGFSSVQSSVLSTCLWPQRLQHARPPCLSPTPGVYSNSCSLSWCTISSSVVPFSSHF